MCNTERSTRKYGFKKVEAIESREEEDMDDIQRLKEDYPWIQTPLVVGAPMRLIALADMAVEVSKAGKSYEKRALFRCCSSFLFCGENYIRYMYKAFSLSLFLLALQYTQLVRYHTHKLTQAELVS